MVVEIDQSGKLEQLDTDTVIAYSNSKSGAVYIRAGVKRKIIQRLRRSLIPQKEIYPILFAMIIYILFFSLGENESILIDEEYTGKESVIKEILKKLFERQFPKSNLGIIRFGRVGKHSPAHKLAWTIHRKKQKTGVRRIKEEEIMELLK